jgi:hypothetical protein
MATKGAKTRACDEAQAKQRLQRASEFLDVANLIVDEKDKDASPVYASAAASLAVLAGIAAADAACCKALGERSRSDNHRDAEQLLARIGAGGGGGRSPRAAQPEGQSPVRVLEDEHDGAEESDAPGREPRRLRGPSPAPLTDRKLAS